MNTFVRTWLTLKHRHKFARLGKRCQFPIPDLHIYGHVEMGDLCRFRNNVTLRTYGDGKIIFGDRSGCSWSVLVEAGELVQIGTYTAIAEYSVITDTEIVLRDNEADWRTAERRTKPVYIGEECFVGSGCYIGPGVTIGRGAVIGNYSIVTRDIPEFEIWTGAPARRIGHRTEGVPESKMREFQQLVAQQGIREIRYR